MHGVKFAMAVHTDEAEVSVLDAFVLTAEPPVVGEAIAELYVLHEGRSEKRVGPFDEDTEEYTGVPYGGPDEPDTWFER